MFHLNTELLIDYWRGRAGEHRIPLRAAINPADLVDLLPQVFILGRRAAGHYQFRLVGGLIADLHQRDLRQTNFISLWAAKNRLPLQTAIEAARRQAVPIVVRATASTSGGGFLDLEIMLAPLATETDGEAERLIGLFQPTSSLARLGARPVEALTAHAIASGGEPQPVTPHLRLAALDGRLTA